jgi:hypothetical protein
MIRSVSPPRSRADDDPKWKLEQESEAAILGNNFAYAIAAIATGNKEKLIDYNNKKQYKSFRKIFYEEPHFNPPLNQASVSSGFDAHLTEQQFHWKKHGTVFPHQERKFDRPKDSGPKKPDQFPFVFEKPIKAYEREGEVRPFSRVKKISSNARLKEVLSLYLVHFLFFLNVII